MERMLGLLIILLALAVGFSLIRADDAQRICEDKGYSTETCFHALNR